MEKTPVIWNTYDYYFYRGYDFLFIKRIFVRVPPTSFTRTLVVRALQVEKRRSVMFHSDSLPVSRGITVVTAISPRDLLPYWVFLDRFSRRQITLLYYRYVLSKPIFLFFDLIQHVQSLKKVLSTYRCSWFLLYSFVCSSEYAS